MAEYNDFEFEMAVRSAGNKSSGNPTATSSEREKRTQTRKTSGQKSAAQRRPRTPRKSGKSGKSTGRNRRNAGILHAVMTDKTPWMIALCIGVLLVLWLVIWLIRSTLIGTSQSSVSKETLTANVQTLVMMEQKDPVNIAAMNEEKQNAQTLAENSTVHVEDEAQEDEQTHIMEMDNPSMSTLLNWFDGTAVVGDSIVEGVSAYEFLNDSIVFGKIGVSVSGADDLISAMTAVYPRKVFLAFGLNDMANYGSDVDKFIEHYTAMIATIREQLPTAGIYVVAVLPVQDKAISKQSKLANVDLYNEKLEEMCNDLEIAFLNPGFILEQDSSFYDADGMHPKGNFYYKWLTYLADMAGISE